MTDDHEPKLPFFERNKEKWIEMTLELQETARRKLQKATDRLAEIEKWAQNKEVDAASEEYIAEYSMLLQAQERYSEAISGCTALIDEIRGYQPNLVDMLDELDEMGRVLDHRSSARETERVARHPSPPVHESVGYEREYGPVGLPGNIKRVRSDFLFPVVLLLSNELLRKPALRRVFSTLDTIGKIV